MARRRRASPTTSPRSSRRTRCPPAAARSRSTWSASRVHRATVARERERFSAGAARRRLTREPIPGAPGVAVAPPGYREGAWRWTASVRPSGRGSRPASPRPPTRRRRAGRRSRTATTRCCSRPPDRARRSPRSCGRSTGSAPRRRPPKDRRCRVLYISPLRALAFDVEKNLRAPLAGITLAAERLGDRVRRADRRHAHRRHAGQGTPAARPQPARHPDHHARVALPDAHVAGARDVARRADRDHRRDPRARAHEARRAPHAVARTARGDHRARRRSASGCRPRSARSTRSRASSAASPSGGATPGHRRRRRLAQVARRRGDRPRRRHERARRALGRVGRDRRACSASTIPRRTAASGPTCTRASSS